MKIIINNKKYLIEYYFDEFCKYKKEKEKETQKLPVWYTFAKFYKILSNNEKDSLIVKYYLFNIIEYMFVDFLEFYFKDVGIDYLIDYYEMVKNDINEHADIFEIIESVIANYIRNDGDDLFYSIFYIIEWFRINNNWSEEKIFNEFITYIKNK